MEETKVETGLVDFAYTSFFVRLFERKNGNKIPKHARDWNVPL